MWIILFSEVSIVLEKILFIPCKDSFFLNILLQKCTGNFIWHPLESMIFFRYLGEDILLSLWKQKKKKKDGSTEKNFIRRLARNKTL
jgi:hypothetical protein